VTDLVKKLPKKLKLQIKEEKKMKKII